MSVHLMKSLISKSAKLKSEIEREKRALHPNWTRLRKMKKLRLMFKDRLRLLEFATAHARGAKHTRTRGYPPDGHLSA